MLDASSLAHLLQYQCAVPFAQFNTSHCSALHLLQSPTSPPTFGAHAVARRGLSHVFREVTGECVAWRGVAWRGVAGDAIQSSCVANAHVLERKVLHFVPWPSSQLAFPTNGAMNVRGALAMAHATSSAIPASLSLIQSARTSALGSAACSPLAVRYASLFIFFKHSSSERCQAVQFLSARVTVLLPHRSFSGSIPPFSSSSTPHVARSQRVQGASPVWVGSRNATRPLTHVCASRSLISRSSLCNRRRSGCRMRHGSPCPSTDDDLFAAH